MWFLYLFLVTRWAVPFSISSLSATMAPSCTRQLALPLCSQPSRVLPSNSWVQPGPDWPTAGGGSASAATSAPAAPKAKANARVVFCMGGFLRERETFPVRDDRAVAARGGLLPERPAPDAAYRRHGRGFPRWREGGGGRDLSWSFPRKRESSDRSLGGAQRNPGHTARVLNGPRIALRSIRA